MGNKISKIYVGTNLVRPVEAPTHTFDFQNDGALNWTGASLYGTPSYVTGEGWTIGAYYTDSQSYIAPPSSVYDGKTLQKVKIRMYKGIVTNYDGDYLYAVGSGVGRQNATGGFIWSNGSVAVSYDNIMIGSSIRTENITGEALIEADYTGATTTITINGNVYNTQENSSLTKSDWSNNLFGLRLGNWRCNNSNIYIRKVQIFTE